MFSGVTIHKLHANIHTDIKYFHLFLMVKAIAALTKDLKEWQRHKLAKKSKTIFKPYSLATQ